MAKTFIQEIQERLDLQMKERVKEFYANEDANFKAFMEGEGTEPTFKGILNSTNYKSTVSEINLLSMKRK